MNGSSCSRNGCSGRGRFFYPKVRWQEHLFFDLQKEYAKPLDK